jgi:hypothetical protein
MSFHIIYVGAGIANLYSAYTHLKSHPDSRVLILEKSGHVGGRVSWAMFQGIEVVKGAGIGRFKKDKLLLNLLKELEIPFVRYKSDLGKSHIKSTIAELERQKMGIKNDSFKEYAIRIIGNSAYLKFRDAVGFTDYENMDARIALDHYGFEDTFGMQESFSFSWHKLIDALKSKLNCIKLYQEVISVAPENVTTCKFEYTTKHIVVGGTIETLQNLFPKVKVYRDIGTQPFLRIYAETTKTLGIQKYTTVSTPLQKLIPIRPDRNIYMISYSDNANAVLLRDASKSQLEKYLQSTFHDSEIKIKTYRKFFIKSGTHFYKPNFKFTDQLQKPIMNANIHVVGEVVAINQGWVDSALKTTQNIKLN